MCVKADWRIPAYAALIGLACLSFSNQKAFAIRVWDLRGATISVLIERDGVIVCDTTEKIGGSERICIDEFNNISDFGGPHNYKITGEVIFSDGNVRSFTFADDDFNESLFGSPDCLPVLLREPKDSYYLQISIACGE